MNEFSGRQSGNKVLFMKFYLKKQKYGNFQYFSLEKQPKSYA